MRTFLSIPIPDAHADALAAANRKLPAGRAVDPELMHITALFLGDPGEEALEDLHDAVIATDIGLPPLTIAGFGHFGHETPNLVYAEVAPVEPLAALHKRLAGRAHQCGIRLEKRNYIPHVTLSRYTRGAVSSLDVAAAFQRLSPFTLDAFQPTELMLVRSHPAKRGPVYETLASYPMLPG